MGQVKKSKDYSKELKEKRQDILDERLKKDYERWLEKQKKYPWRGPEKRTKKSPAPKDQEDKKKDKAASRISEKLIHLHQLWEKYKNK